MGRSFFYITAGDEKEAERVATSLVEKNLVACANVMSGVKSFFRWEGEVQSKKEFLVVGKTRTSLIEDLVQEVKNVHSYDVPCVITWPIEKGNPDFLRWIDSETKK